MAIFIVPFLPQRPAPQRGEITLDKLAILLHLNNFVKK